MVIFSEIERQLTVSQINSIEHYIGLDFPEDYKNHLLRYNGGYCTPNIFSFDENGKTSYSIVDWFLAIYDGKYNNLKSYIDMYKVEEKRLPLHILPIARDPGGNLICISCGTSDKGMVYYWDHENEVDYAISMDSDYSNLYLIAGSFNEFLDGLKNDF